MHPNPASGDPENRLVSGSVIDQWIEAAAGVLTTSGQPHFMDIDLARIAFHDQGVPPIPNNRFTASLARLCQSEILTPFVAPIIIRTLLRGPHRIRPRPSSPAGQILSAIDDEGGISGPRLIQLVRRRNSLITFTSNEENWF
ncbi:hypothetical protein FB472_2316 [Rhodoglobus vestalii]|uniref:Uncharacterized protein n=1 Tax=Rhodoglobus vestalii TaxID=193384 RepID=A0A8H2KCH0_9MICO|nr:hypothetical protein [Rhodoglobus vestalii]TQO20671.1 hypothetical protein FB472_2316 [Rhodoglobus vestalii]